MRARCSMLLAGAALLLAGCNQKEGTHVTIKDKDGNVTISANGQHFTMHADDGSKSDVTIAGNGGHFTMHAGDGKSVVDINASGSVSTSGKLPDFVGVYPGAKVTATVTGGDSKSSGGSVSFETRAAPTDIIGFYKQKTAAAGFKQNIDVNTGGTLMYGATSGGRSIQVLAAKDGDHAHAQITWAGE